MLGLAVLLGTVAVAAPTAAPSTVTSPAPSSVAITVYRDPTREKRRAMDLNWLGGFALVTETRTIHVPAGQAILRFEGVADGIVPASAIVTGLPGGVIEKNRDARLLSPAALVDGTLGRAVTVRRTDPKSGKAAEEDATIVVGAANGVVLLTRSGIETLRCSGLDEALAYGGVPPGLSARPVLSVVTRSPQATDVTVRLSYLTGGFDWSASYVATVAPDGNKLDLFAWLTVANANSEDWRGIPLQAVAGRLERQKVREIMAAAAELRLRCYPLGTTTSDLPTIEPYKRRDDSDGAGDIIVTARRVAAPMASPSPPPPPPPPEDFGDLKLYRVPETVDVAPNGQKQVALLARHRVTYAKVYRFRFRVWQFPTRRAAAIVLRLHNDTAHGLGIPLPAGTTTLYQPRRGTRLLLGTGTMADTAKGETARLTAGVSPQVLAEQSGTGRERRVVVTNANRFPVLVEVALGEAGDRLFADLSTPLERSDGIQTWRVTVPANGFSTLTYKLRND